MRNGIWASVCFQGQGGRCEELLDAAASAGIRLRRIETAFGGYTAECPAWEYRTLTNLARRYHVRMKIRKKKGIFFVIRPLFRCKGILLGIVVSILLMGYLQKMVWYVDCAAAAKEQQRWVEYILWENGLRPGVLCGEKLLEQGEYALMTTGKFSWVNLNFEKGRLTVEAAAAKPKPEIAEEDTAPLLAGCDGMIVELQLQSGTPAAVTGQVVSEGQLLIGAARTERNGTLIIKPAAGKVLAQIAWEFETEVPMQETIQCAEGSAKKAVWVTAAGHEIKFGTWDLPVEAGLIHERHIQPTIMGLPLPLAVQERCCYLWMEREVDYPQSLALSLARQREAEAMQQRWPGAEVNARQELVELEDGLLRYHCTAIITADICVRLRETSAAD